MFMQEVLLITTQLGLSELGGRATRAGGFDVLELLREVAHEHALGIVVRLVEEVSNENIRSEDWKGILGYAISYTPGLPYFRDLRSIIAPFDPDGWPSAYSIKRAFSEYLGPTLSKYATI